MLNIKGDKMINSDATRPTTPLLKTNSTQILQKDEQSSRICSIITDNIGKTCIAAGTIMATMSFIMGGICVADDLDSCGKQFGIGVLGIAVLIAGICASSRRGK